MKKNDFIKLIPIFILFVIIFKLIYHDNGVIILLRVCVPIFIAIFIAVILNPLLKIIEKVFKNRILSIIIVYLIFLGVIVLAITVIVPSIMQSVSDFMKDIPNMIDNINNFFANPPEKLDFLLDKESYKYFEENIYSVTERATEIITTLLNKAVSSVISVTSKVINFILGILISIYILHDKEHFGNLFYKSVYSLFDNKNARELIKIGHELNNNVTKFIIGKIFDSIIIGIIAFIGTKYVLKAPYALIISLIIGITNMIPYFGPLIGGIPAVIITTLFNPIKGLWMILFVFILQQFDGWVLGPKILGIQLALKPVWIVTAVIIGGGLFGPIGMFLATPIAAVCKTIIKGYMQMKLKNRNVKLPYDEKE